MVLDWGVHLLDQMNMMMGKMPVSVYATLSNVTNEEVDDGFTATFKFDNDLVFTVEVGTSNFINLPRWYVEGLNGTAVIDDQVNGKIVSGLLSCPPTRKFMRGRMLELPLKPLLHITFVSVSLFIFSRYFSSFLLHLF